MPVPLDPTQQKTTPAVNVPSVTFPNGWVSRLIIQWPHGTAGTASVEIHPLSADGTRVLTRNPDGTDAVIQTHIVNLAAAMQRCPELAAVMAPLLTGVHAWNAIVVADAAAAEQARLDAIAAEAARLAQIEADRAAAIEAARIAEEARLAQLEADRLAAIEAARIAAEEAARLEAERLAAYNEPAAKAARVAAAQAEVERLAAESERAQAELDAVRTPQVLAEIAIHTAIEDERQKALAAQSLVEQAAAAQAELERLQAE